MEILVLSDSHGNTSKFEKILSRHPNIELILHLGDYATDVLRMAELKPGIEFEAVQGNCDRQKLYTSESTFEIEGKRLFVTHGHNYGVKGTLTALVAKGIKEKADIILYGHTHIPRIEMLEGIWVVNPGSISSPKDMSGATYAVLEITGDTINARHIGI